MKTHFAGTSHKAKAEATKRGGTKSERPHEELGISLASIARVLGLEKSHLRRVVNGERNSPATMEAYEGHCARIKAAHKQTLKLRTATATA